MGSWLSWLHGMGRWIAAVLVLAAAVVGLVAYSSDGSSVATTLQSLTSVRIDSESPIKSVSTKKLNGNHFRINVKTKQGAGTGPMLPPKDKLKRWRDVKWWSDDFTKKCACQLFVVTLMSFHRQAIRRLFNRTGAQCSRVRFGSPPA